jgi:hypothetical protein
MTNRYVLRVVECVSGVPTPFDGLYVKAYDPSFWPPGEEYDGGLAEFTDDPNDALHFPDVFDALEKWREAFGMREDGRPNRPLTAWTCEVLPLEIALYESSRTEAS